MLASAHGVKQHHNCGHLGQRHRAVPVAVALAFVVALVEQTLRKQRLELLEEVVDEAKKLCNFVRHGAPS